MESVPIGGLTCDTAGIINPAVGMVVVHQTVEALKILVEDWDACRKKLISFDLWTNQQSMIDVSNVKRENCLSCGKEPTYPFLSFENQTKIAVLCGRDTVQIRPAKVEKRDLQTLAKVLSENGRKVERNPFLLSVTIDNQRMVMFQDGRALVHGTNDIAKAKTLYHRYFG